MCEKLDKARVQEDTRAEAVEHTGDQGSMRRFRVVCRAHAEAHGDAYGRRDPIEERAQVGYEVVFVGEDEVRKP